MSTPAVRIGVHATGRSGLPALFAGSALGGIAFHRVNETVFRKTVLVLLLISGISLI
ncbi:putative membrane protein YfcA [Bradyrhizobium sp. USDA 377]